MTQEKWDCALLLSCCCSPAPCLRQDLPGAEPGYYAVR